MSLFGGITPDAYFLVSSAATIRFPFFLAGRKCTVRQAPVPIKCSCRKVDAPHESKCLLNRPLPGSCNYATSLNCCANLFHCILGSLDETVLWRATKEISAACHKTFDRAIKMISILAYAAVSTSQEEHSIARPLRGALTMITGFFSILIYASCYDKSCICQLSLSNIYFLSIFP